MAAVAVANLAMEHLVVQGVEGVRGHPDPEVVRPAPNDRIESSEDGRDVLPSHLPPCASQMGADAEH